MLGHEETPRNPVPPMKNCLPAFPAAGSFPPHSQFVAKTALEMKMAIRPAPSPVFGRLSLLAAALASLTHGGWRIDSGGASRGGGVTSTCWLGCMAELSVVIDQIGIGF